MTEANCDTCEGFPPMTWLFVAHGNRFYPCQKCGAVREDVYHLEAIARQVWHNSPDTLSSETARHGAERVLETVRTEQLELKL